jgi:hypothetical protein
MDQATSNFVYEFYCLVKYHAVYISRQIPNVSEKRIASIFRAESYNTAYVNRNGFCFL